MSKRLSGKTAVVMGAGSVGSGWGNGKAIAVLYAREGANVVCVDYRLEAAQETAQIITAKGGSAMAIQADVTKKQDIIHVHDTVLAHFDAVHVLNNNVGIVTTGGVEDITEEQWDHNFNTNLKSCFLAMQVFVPTMKDQGGGSIINTSSIASIRYTGVPYITYAASKAAMNHLTRTTAAQYAPFKVRVNALLPGLIKTPMVEQAAGLIDEYGKGDVEAMWQERDSQVPMGHMGEAFDVAYASLFLASDESKYVTGIELLVDGGIALKC